MRLLFSDPRGRALADAHGEVLLRNWLRARGNYFRTLLRQIVTGAALEVLATVGVLAIGGWLVISRELTLGQLVAASVLVSQIGAGVRGLGQQLDPVFEGVAAVQTFAATLDAELEPRGGELLPAAARPMAVELTADAAHLTIAPGERGSPQPREAAELRPRDQPLHLDAERLVGRKCERGTHRALHLARLAPRAIDPALHE